MILTISRHDVEECPEWFTDFTIKPDMELFGVSQRDGGMEHYFGTPNLRGMSEFVLRYCEADSSFTVSREFEFRNETRREVMFSMTEAVYMVMLGVVVRLKTEPIYAQNPMDYGRGIEQLD